MLTFSKWLDLYELELLADFDDTSEEQFKDFNEFARYQYHEYVAYANTAVDVNRQRGFLVSCGLL